MQRRHFQQLLEVHQAQNRFLCVGLDSDVSKIPSGQTQLSFNKAIIAATKDIVAAYKPNVAFYEAEGVAGWETLKKTIQFILEEAPQTLVILDAKRADIGNTNLGYAKAAFEELEADAITLNPYIGGEALQPFLDYQNKGCFILCRTSNEGAKEFQDLEVGGEPLYLKVAKQVSQKWNKNKNCGLVVGATFPEELKKVREAAPDLPFLVPGVGTQGGDAKTVLKNAGKNCLINVSRSVLFASNGPHFAEDARNELLKLLR